MRCWIKLLLLTLVLAVAAVLLPGVNTEAATFTVTNTDDYSSTDTVIDYSLRWAVNHASAGDTIAFSTALSTPVTITLKEPLAINQSVIIDGGNNIIYPVTINGNYSYRAFVVTNASLTLNNLTLYQCKAPDSSAGGAIYFTGSASSDNLLMNDCKIIGSKADNGGGIYCDGAASATFNNCIFDTNTDLSGSGGGLYITNSASAVLSGCSFNSNHATKYGGAICCMNSALNIGNCNFSDNSTQEGHGGAIYADAEAGNTRILALSECSFRNSAAKDCGGNLYVSNYNTFTADCCLFMSSTANAKGGSIYTDSVVTSTLTRCTFDGNAAVQEGGGLYANCPGTITLTNCTFKGNQGGSNANIYGGAAYINDATHSGTGERFSVTNCTFVDNTAGYIDGMYTDYIDQVSLSNSILWDEVPWGSINISGLSFGHCIVKNSTWGGTINNKDPLLGSLGDYGGSVPTIPLLPGSPAIDAGSDWQTPTSDARAMNRVNGVDLGAFESQGFTLNPIPESTPQYAVINTGFDNDLKVKVTPKLAGEQVAGGVVSFAVPESGASAALSAKEVTIDNNGEASVTATANGTEGTYMVRAGISATDYVDFILTNSQQTSSTSDLGLVLNDPPSAQLIAGAKLNVSVTVTNLGDDVSPVSVVNIYIDEQLVATKKVSKLKPDKSKTVKVKFTIPTFHGTTLKARVIPSGLDVNTGNNIASAPVSIILPDIIVTSVTPKKALTPGKSGTLTVGIENMTVATAKNFLIRVYRDADEILGEKKVSSLKQGNKNFSIKINVPADYDSANDTLRVWVDPLNSVTEEDENNNTASYLNINI